LNKLFTILLIIIPVSLPGQNGSESYRFWNQKYLRGEMGALFKYRDQFQRLGSGFEEKLDSKMLGGRFLFESGGFMVHPNLLNLDVGLEYNPEKLDEDFIVIPDRAEVRTLKRLNLRAGILQEKDINLNGFINLNQNYVNRENLTNSRTNRVFYGGGIFFRNRVMPLSVTYQEGNWDQEEIETGRLYAHWQRNIKATANKSFYSADRHSLTYSYDDYIRTDFNAQPRQNTVNLAELRSSLPFDRGRKYTLNTILSNRNQKGADSFNRFQANGNMILKFPLNFRLSGSYNFYDYSNPLYNLAQQRGKLDLSHQLFKSLRSSVYSEISVNKHSLYREQQYRTGFRFDYTKKIPFGTLNLGYAFFNRQYKKESDPLTIMELNEEHILSDSEIVLLNKPFAETESIVVKDITGTVIYQQYFDYILLEHNNFTEIKRVPGGQIQDKSGILVDYITKTPGSYQYNLNNNTFNIRLLLFKNYLEVYYRRATQNYNNFKGSDLMIMNYFTQNVAGAGLNFGIARLGIEYDDYQSSIIPYRLIRYYANIQWSLKNKLLVSFNGNLRNYIFIAEREDEIFLDFSGRLAYRITPSMKLSADFAYRDQNGYQIDLNLLTVRTELTYNFRKIYLTAGMELYRRDYLNRETINFNGAFIRIIRKF
jgi:hypothetical protein